jgi:hypothetical protein
MRRGVASVREGLELLEQLEELQLLRRATSSTKRGDARRITKALLRREDAGILRAETCADDGDEDPHDGTQIEDDDEDIFRVESHSPRELKDDIRSLIFPRTHLQRLQRGQWLSTRIVQQALAIVDLQRFKRSIPSNVLPGRFHVSHDTFLLRK